MKGGNLGSIDGEAGSDDNRGLVDALPTIAEVQKSLGSDSGCVLALRNVKTGKGRPKGSVVKPPSWTQSYWNSLSHQEKAEKKAEYNKTNKKKKKGGKKQNLQDIRRSFPVVVISEVPTQVLSLECFHVYIV